jgi:hypothetical protein
MMTPLPPCDRMKSTAVHEARTVPRTSTASRRSSFSSGGRRPASPVRMSAPALLILLPAHIHAHDLGTPTDRANLRRRLLGALLVSPEGDGELGAFPRAREGDRLPDAAGRSGDEYDLSGQRHAASPRYAGRANFNNG